MSKTILITGGAGFIGSHVTDHLLQSGYAVRAIDPLDPQIHGSNPVRPRHLNPAAELIVGDIRDPVAVRNALRGVDGVVHLAARTGIGRSMYQLFDFTSINIDGTAHLLEALIHHPVERLVVASSMHVYGEGMYQEAGGRLVPGEPRSLDQLHNRTWDLWTKEGEILLPVPTPETKHPGPTSVYALSKYAQERMCLLTGRAYGIPAIALRFFNVYGPRQAFSNPHAGVLAVFASRLLNDRSPLILEDGYQQRDFVSVHDVARACQLALELPAAGENVFNVGSGSHFTIREIAARLAVLLGKEHIELKITNKHRIGDVRHCFADIRQARQLLGFQPAVSLEAGLAELAGWLQGRMVEDHLADASEELESRGLTV